MKDTKDIRLLSTKEALYYREGMTEEEFGIERLYYSVCISCYSLFRKGQYQPLWLQKEKLEKMECVGAKANTLDEVEKIYTLLQAVWKKDSESENESFEWVTPTLKEAPYYRFGMSQKEYEAEREYYGRNYTLVRLGKYKPLWIQKFEQHIGKE